MQINVTYDASVANAPAGFKDCVAAACAFFDATFTAPVTINIGVGYGEIAGTDMSSTELGESLQASYFPATYTQLRNALIEEGARLRELLVDIGDADPFLAEQLRPELLERACAGAGIPLTLRRQPGYDHSYYFISTFMADHLHWHAARLKP